jgi:hypothetical protein
VTGCGSFPVGPRKPSSSLETELAELSSATGAVLQDLPIVFRSLGTGDAAKGQNAVCLESLRNLAPFRWAVDVPRMISGQKSSEIGKLWQDYLVESNHRQGSAAAARSAREAHAR